GRCADGVLERRPEARPAGAALELRVGREQILSTAGTPEHAVPFFGVQWARARPLGSMLPQNVKLLAGQRLPPLILRLLDLGCRSIDAVVHTLSLKQARSKRRAAHLDCEEHRPTARAATENSRIGLERS